MTFVMVGGRRLDPESIITANTPADVPDALDKLQTALDDGYYAAGFFSYELGYILESKLNARFKKPKLPLLWFGLSKTLTQYEPTGTYNLGAFDTDPREDYIPRCKKILGLINAGEIYQANLTIRSRASFTGSPEGLYADLLKRQPSPYAGLIHTPDFSILSLSPELFIQIDNNQIITRPMKGTSARGLNPDHDLAQKEYLKTDPKQRAENLMIVDLMRNDLGRIARDIRVNDMFAVETHPTLHQMTTDISGTLTTTNITDILRAIFPPGSITGAPKIRAMEIISDLEDTPRGAYCGALGLLSKHKSTLNVTIRTLTIQNNTAEIGIGSGVVADSDPASEYDECLLKMRFLEAPEHFALIETLRYDGGYYLLDEHLARLKYSCELLNFTLPDIAWPTPDAPCVVRLQLERNGTYTFTTRPIPDNKTMTIKIAPERLSSSNPLLFHKTTRRDLYDRPLPPGIDEYIYLNERGELCEGARTNLFIKRGNTLLTPALACGLLPGTLRSHLLKTGQAKEAILTPEALKSADSVYLGNAVRGLVLAQLNC